MRGTSGSAQRSAINSAISLLGLGVGALGNTEGTFNMHICWRVLMLLQRWSSGHMMHPLPSVPRRVTGTRAERENVERPSGRDDNPATSGATCERVGLLARTPGLKLQGDVAHSRGCSGCPTTSHTQQGASRPPPSPPSSPVFTSHARLLDAAHVSSSHPHPRRRRGSEAHQHVGTRKPLR